MEPTLIVYRSTGSRRSKLLKLMSEHLYDSPVLFRGIGSSKGIKKTRFWNNTNIIYLISNDQSFSLV